MEASYSGTRARSTYELGEGMSEPDIKRGRSPDRDRGPQKEEKRAGLMEVCLFSVQCSQRHKPFACDKFKGLSLHHWQSVIAAKELCVCCLRQSDLDAVKVKECTRRKTLPHWLGSDVREPGAPLRQERDLLPVEAKAGRLVLACRTNIRVKTESDSHEEIYSAELATLFSTTRQMSVITLSAAIGQGLPYRTVPEVNVMLGDGRREKSPQAFLPRGQTSQGYSTRPASASTFFGGSVRSQRGCPRAAPPAGEVQCEAFSHQGGTSSMSWTN